MRAALLGEDIAGEMVAPPQQRHLEFEPRRRVCERRRRGRGAILETVGGDDRKSLADVAEPETAGIEHMRAEIASTPAP